MLTRLYRYGVDDPGITWISFILGLILVVVNKRYFLWIPGIILLLITLFMLLRTSRKYQLINDVINHCDLRTAYKILDVGSENGYFLTHITKAAGHIAFVTGIEDQTRNHIKRARKNARKELVGNRINVIHGDVRHLPFPGNSFNLVVSTDAGKDFGTSRSDYQAICKEIIRVLKQDGNFLMVGNLKKLRLIKKYLDSQDNVATKLKSDPSWRFGHWGSLKMLKKN